MVVRSVEERERGAGNAAASLYSHIKCQKPKMEQGESFERMGEENGGETKKRPSDNGQTH